MKPTKELLKAFNHVRDVFPNVSTVVINIHGQWCYMDDDFKAPKFNDEIDISMLIDAADSIKELPFIYQEFILE